MITDIGVKVRIKLVQYIAGLDEDEDKDELAVKDRQLNRLNSWLWKRQQREWQ